MSTSASYNIKYLTAEQRAMESKVFFVRAMALCEKQIRSSPSLEIGRFHLSFQIPCIRLTPSDSDMLSRISTISLVDEPILARN